MSWWSLRFTIEGSVCLVKGLGVTRLICMNQSYWFIWWISQIDSYDTDIRIGEAYRTSIVFSRSSHHVAHEWVMSRMIEWCRTCMRHVIHRPTNQTSRIQCSHGTRSWVVSHVSESCHGSHCNTLQHTIQHSATCYVIHCNALHKSLPLTHCDALQHNATHYTIHCSTICNTLQYTSEWSSAHIRVWDRTSRVYNENVFYVAPDTCIVFWSKENTVSSM